ncbi:hypothetical protein N7509_004687 [Penicillium cosmopolitanum]|uniref:Uncharacterized protein n=1 Tax=Penicillium cosmopolitanum TaxID=1131564 RepID=A0A9X0B9E4_9EURO|nr:uncharacterized protein N7509_004687 [Penicillium cosmopolitanum]KAJ5396574.1 hypothetical protein N7509_004687 [Penicillium cosmopolitanum]
MKVAEILSDLTSLRVCDHHAALALVNAHQISLDTSPPSQSNPTATDAITDLQRAKELVELHYEVKARHVNGQVDADLQKARVDVQQVLRELS